MEEEKVTPEKLAIVLTLAKEKFTFRIKRLRVILSARDRSLRGC